jgi:HK97 gp10 family phage protein
MMKVTGIEETSRRLQELDTAVATKIGRRAVRAGAKVMLKATKAEAPFRSGLTRRSLRIKNLKPKQQGIIAASVGMARSAFKGKAFYSYFVLRGWRHGKRPSTGRRLLRTIAGKIADVRKFIPANPFIQRAYLQATDTAAEKMAKSLIRGVQREASK